MDQLQQQEEEEDGGLKDGGLEALFQPETAASRVERAELRLTDSQTVRRVYLLAGLVARLLAEADITHWTSGGTTLGIVRHSGLIPWDDDIDLCILSQDAGKLKLLGTELEGAGCGIVQSNSYLWKIFHLTDSEEVRGRRVQYRYPAADLFIMNRHRGGYQLADKAGRAAWPAEQYSVEQVAGVEYRQFGPHLLPCPASPEIYLDRYSETLRSTNDSWTGCTGVTGERSAGLRRRTTRETPSSSQSPSPSPLASPGPPWPYRLVLCNV